MREFVYGLICGAAVMYLYVRLDPPKVLDYLNAATKSAVESTHGYGGTKRK
ncbi:MAG: hypothetical protein U0587_05535 [Candidatus Binatia bacterium]